MSIKHLEVAPGVYRLRVFTPSQSRSVLEELQGCTVQNGQPNSMNKYGCVISTRRAPRLIDMQNTIVACIAREHFPDLNSLKKHPYAFTVEYDVKKQRSLSSHFDSSSITLNLCLAGKFKGGDVVFYGDKSERYVIPNEIGYAIIHLGSHIHRATKLVEGWRVNLILWCAERSRRR